MSYKKISILLLFATLSTQPLASLSKGSIALISIATGITAGVLTNMLIEPSPYPLVEKVYLTGGKRSTFSLFVDGELSRKTNNSIVTGVLASALMYRILHYSYVIANTPKTKSPQGC